MTAETTTNRSSVCSDSPLKVGAKDQLNMKDYHQTLIKFIEDAHDDDTPITIAIQGEWGSGKTSIMNILKTELCESDNAKFYSVNINTWKFCMLDSTSKTSSSQAVINILQSMIYQIMALKPNNSQRERIDAIINKIAVATSSAKSIYDIVGEPLLSHVGVNKSALGFVGKILNTLKSIGNKKEKKPEDNVSLIEQLHKEVEDLVKDILDDKQEQVLPYDNRNVEYCFLQKNQSALFDVKAMPFTTVQVLAVIVNSGLYLLDYIWLTACQLFLFLIELISNIFLTAWRVFYFILKIIFDFCIYFGSQIGCILNKNSCNLFKSEKSRACANNVYNNKKGFIFFIDDLDRIQPELALEILEILKNLFDVKHCIFIVAIDPSVLNEAIKKKLAKLANVNPLMCHHYYEKLIQIYVQAPVAFYDTTPMLKNELARISYFNADELNDQDLIKFLKNVIKESINNNPRLLKMIINRLSLANIMINKLQKRKEYNECFGIFEKKLVFVISSIIIAFPEVFIVISMFPYFRDWSNELLEAYNVQPVNQKFLQQLKLSKEIDFEDSNKHAPWELALFRMCQYNDYNNGFNTFEKVLKLLKLIDEIFIKEIDGDYDKYKKLIVKFFKIVNGQTPSDSDL